MAGGRNDQILRFLVQAEGADALKPFLESVKELEGASEDTKQAADALLKELETAAGLQKTLTEFDKLSSALGRTTERYEATKVQVDALAKQLTATEKPSKRQIEDFNNAQAALKRYGDQTAVQSAKLGQLSTELKTAGIATTNFVDAQAQIATRGTQAAQSLTQLASAARAAKTEQNALAAAQGDLEAKLTVGERQAIRAAVAAEKLARATESVSIEQQAAAAKSTVLGTAWTKLAAIGATLAGYLTINAAVQGVKNLLGLADATEKTRIRLEALYGSQEAGNKAFADLRALSQATGQEFAATAEAAARLKSFGIEPLNGSLQALIDQNARLGGSQETLNGLILAVGQAWAKQKLQGEEILQLVERGVPVWDLLSKATGKNVLELQKLSEAGKLGRTEIAALVQEIGASASGAAAQNLGTFGGLITQIKDQWQQFLQQIADAGVLQYAKDQLTGLIDEVKRLAQDGTLAQWAKSTADGLKTIGGLIAGSVKFVVEYSGALYELAKAFAAIKIGQLLLELGQLTTRLGLGKASLIELAAQAATTNLSFGSLGAGIAKLPSLVRLSIVAVGIELTLSQIGKVLEAYDALYEAQKRMNAERVGERDANEALRGQLQGIKDLFVSYADIAIKSTQEISDLNAGNARSYETALQNAQKYYRALEIDARRAGDAVALGEAQQKLREITGVLGLVGEQVKATATEAENLTARVGEFGRTMAAQFLAAKEAGTDAAAAISSSFNSLDLTTGSGLTNALDAIRAISGLSKEAGDALEENLRSKLAKLSAEDFAKFQDAAAKAFGASTEKAKELDRAISGVSLARLGVDIDALKAGFTSTGEAAVAAFESARKEVGELGLTAEVQSAAIAQAFDAAFSRVSTRPELESLRNQLNAAFNEGKISAADYERALAALNARLDELAGKSAPAADRTREVSSAMREAAGAADDAAEATGEAAKETENFGYAAAAAKVELGNLSEEMIELALGMQSQARSSKEIIKVWEGVTAAYTDQNNQVQERLRVLRSVVDANDEEGRSLQLLKQRYDSINDGTLQELARLEAEAAEVLRKKTEQTNAAAEAERAYREELEQSAATDQSSGEREFSKNIRVEVIVRADASVGGQTLSQTVLDQIVAKITPAVTRAVLDELETNQAAAGF